MRMKTSANASAMRTSVIVALIYIFPPNGQFAASLRSLAVQACAAFPCSGFFSNPDKSCAFSRAKFRSFVSGVEQFSACRTSSFWWWVASRPAFFGAIMSGFIPISLYIKRLIALDACFGDLSVFHAEHYNTISPAYVAITLQRFQDHTGILPLLLPR